MITLSPDRGHNEQNGTVNGGAKPHAIGSRITRKVLLTGGAGGGAYIITDMFDQPVISSLTLSAFIGGVTLVIQFLIDFEARLGRATETFSLIATSALRTDEVTQLVRHATRIGPQLPPLARDLARSEVARISDFLKQLGDGGEVIYHGEDRDWLLGLARNARSAIDTTSLTTMGAAGESLVDLGLWNSDLGQRYLEAQREAVDRGVAIRRIFILAREELADDPRLIELCRLHREVGIQVRILDPSAFPGKRRSSLFDFAIFDNILSYEVTPSSFQDPAKGPIIGLTRLVLSPIRVAERIQGFKDLWCSAHDPK